MRHPAFIVGSPRSGTSILVDGLLAAGYKGFREGNFLSVWNPIERAIDRHFEIFANGSSSVLVSVVNKHLLKENMFRMLYREVEHFNPEVPWFDKTGNPEMIMSMPMVRRAWPSSALIFAKRRGIENIVSRMKKFPNHNFRYHCADWARTMSAWRTVRAQLPMDTYSEIDQQSMIRRPEAAAAALRELLQLEEPEAAALSRTLRANRPQETDSGSAERVLSLEASGWTKEQVSIFIELCGDEMTAFGYTLDDTYSVES